MSVQESASALVNLLSYIGLPKIKVDVIRQMKLNSPEILNESIHILWSFIMFLQRNRADHSVKNSKNTENISLITSVNSFTLSQGFHLFISATNINCSSLDLIILLWCLYHWRIDFLPETIFNGMVFSPPVLHAPMFPRKILPAKSVKQCLLNISSITSVIFTKEIELSLLFKAVLNQTHKLHLKFPPHPLSSLQRNMTLLELLYVLNDNTNSKNNDVVKFKRLLDTLTKWNRNSSAFYRWARLPNDNVLSDSNKYIPNPSDVISRQDIYRSYDLLQKQRLILRRYGPELDTIMTDITHSNQYKLQTEFKQRLDFISDCLKTLPYQIHPMENFSIASETSTILHKFDAKIEKQILQSLVSSLKSQVDHRNSLIHSRIKGAYSNLLPNVYCFHKSV